MNSRGHNNNNRSGRRGDSSRSTPSRTNSNFNDGDDDYRNRHHHQREREQCHPQPPKVQPQAPVLNLPLRDQADLDTFRVALKELTFNSRPVIEKLTQMARERAKSIPGPVSRSILDNLVFVRNQL